MAAKDILGHTPKPKETKTSGYIDTPVPKACENCEYVRGTLCSNRIVLRDSQIPKDKISGLKIIDPKDGCCNLFTPSDEARKKFS